MKLVINERLKGKRLYKEVWKPVVLLDTGEDYTGLYEVSNMGRVRSFDKHIMQKNGRTRFIKGRILKTYGDKNGYPMVDLYKYSNKKKVHVHRLVGYAFVKGYFEGACIDHINTIKTYNIWTNLRWVTHKENSHNELTKEHMRLREYPKGENNPNYGVYKDGSKIICFETRDIFKSIAEAGRQMKCDSSDICNHLKGRNNYAGKHPVTGEPLHWFYYEDYLNYTEDELNKKFLEFQKGKVICLETKKVYNSMKEAGELNNISPSNIGTCCNGRQYTAGDYHWQFYVDYLNETEEEHNLRMSISKKRKVICLDTGKKYESISEASRRTGVEISAIQYCCNGKLKTAGGYTFKYLTEEGDN